MYNGISCHVSNSFWLFGSSLFQFGLSTLTILHNTPCARSNTKPNLLPRSLPSSGGWSLDVRLISTVFDGSRSPVVLRVLMRYLTWLLHVAALRIKNCFFSQFLARSSDWLMHSWMPRLLTVMLLSTPRKMKSSHHAVATHLRVP